MTFWDQPWLDEAVARREARRIGRWLRAGKLPALHFAGVVVLSWLVAPALFALVGAERSLLGRPGWPLASLLAAVAVGAMSVAFGRCSQLWWSEQNAGTLAGWVLSRQETKPLVVTATGSAVAMAAALSLAPALLVAFNALPASGRATIGLTALAAAGILGALAVLLAAALSSAIFFLLLKTRPVRPVAVAGVLFGAAWIGLWLWVERVERGWYGPWEDHPARMLFALFSLTPLPHLFGLAARDGWSAAIAGRLPGHPSPLVTTLLLSLFYLVQVRLLLAASWQGFQRLRADPELLERAVAAEPQPEPGGEPYWSGFRNPVWTRELRTRLRSREAAEVLFFASIAIAAAGFIPLFVAGGQLADPLRAAAVAREVFFWLAMTLAAFLTLLTPGLTAEAVGLERARGTLELLVATPMRAGEILRGKLLGALCIVLLLLSPSLPLLGLCVLFHGASVGQVAGLYAVLAFHLLVCAAFGITASAIHERVLSAKIQAYLLAFFYAGMPGGALWSVAALALPSAGSRAGLQHTWMLAPGAVLFCAAVIAWCWGAATERLAHVERPS